MKISSLQNSHHQIGIRTQDFNFTGETTYGKCSLLIIWLSAWWVTMSYILKLYNLLLFKNTTIFNLIQDRNIAIIVPLLCCLLFGTSTAGECGISALEKPLSEVFTTCTSGTLSRTRDCAAAMHRFCIQSTYSTGLAYAHVGVSREYTNDRIDLACISSVIASLFLMIL